MAFSLQPSAFSLQPSCRRDGMTVIEVILAVVILGIVMVGLFSGLSNSTMVFRASAEIREAENALNMGESLYPLIVNNDPVSDLEVSPDEVIKGWTFERSVEESPDEDGLYIVRTIVKQGRGAGPKQEYTRLFFHKK